MPPFAISLYHLEPNGRLVLHAMPVLLASLCVLAIAYRFYSKFLAAYVVAIDPNRVTPAVRLNDGQNYHPTNKWVLFGHHFAAISGAGPLIGPVFAVQYGWAPGLFWLLVGVCLAGAVQDMLVLAASVRHDGKSIAEIARAELGRPASIVASAAILFIVIIALAGLGIIVVKALGGESVRRPDGSLLVVPGSSWGTFTIAATIPIALFVGLWMYRIRKGRVLEASLIGGALTLAAVVVGAWIPGSSLEPIFSLTQQQTIAALGIYGFIAAVLPVWLLLGPRDYLSSFLKIGTIALLVFGVLLANPPLHAPALNEVFINGGPTMPGNLFPFVFICVMCGAVSGFHSLVSSGTTPKMIENENQIRPIGYGAMLMECVVGVTALIAAAALPNSMYLGMNVKLEMAQDSKMQAKLQEVYERYGKDRMHAAGAGSLTQLSDVEAQVGESLHGRTGGAPTLAVGMSVIFTDAFHSIGVTAEGLLKYWYHFAIMFEALFILTTIDAGTRIGRFLLQETAGRIYAPFARKDWLPGSLLASAAVCGGWTWLIASGSVETIWPMFGIANQLLAVLALAIVSTWLVNIGRGRYLWVTVPPMLFVMSTTLTAGATLVTVNFPTMIAMGKTTAGYLNIALTLFVMCSVLTVVIVAAARWIAVLRGR